MATLRRNSPCPCGSGRKYKQCCGALAQGNGGQARSPAREGLDYLTGVQREPRPGYGLELIEKAAESDDPQGAYLAATVSSCSFWRPCDWEKALAYLQRAAELGHGAAQSSLRLLAGGPEGQARDSEDWTDLRKSVDLASWFNPPEPTRVKDSPRISTVESFLSRNVCDWLIKRGQGRLSRATIYDNSTGDATEDRRRTNTQCDLDMENCGVLTFVIRGRISAVTGRPDPAMEIAKILHYLPGETFAPHYDYLNPNEPAYAAQLASRGQRSDTFLIYLNDRFEGGETHFPEIEYSYRGDTGDAIWFRNVDDAGRPDEATIHTGRPPTSGEKWIFSQWIRELPRT